MAFDGNGNWVSNFSAEADRDAGYKILASRFDNIFIADIAQSFENCLTKDAQVKPQTNFDANNYKVINVKDPTSNLDAVNLKTLNTKDGTAVHKTGTETISGNKTLSGSTTISGASTISGNITSSGTNTWRGPNTFTNGVFAKSSSSSDTREWFYYIDNLRYTLGTTPSSNIDSAIAFRDSTSAYTAILRHRYKSDGEVFAELLCRKPDKSATTSLSVGFYANGNAYSLAPTPSTSTGTTSTQIATTGWVNSVGNNVMHLSGAETAAGVKTFTDNPIVKKSGYASVVLRNDNITKGTGVDASVGAIEFKDSSGSNMGVIGTSYNASKMNRVRLTVYKANASSDTASAELAVYYPNSGDPYAACPTPSSATDNSTKIATTAWVNSFIGTTSTKATIASYAMPNYSAATTITSGWTATGNGWVYGKNTTGDQNFSISIDGTLITGASVGHGGYYAGIVPVAKNSVVTFAGNSPTVYFAPCKGG